VLIIFEVIDIKNIAFGRPMIGKKERSAVDKVLQGPILTHGKNVKEFEKKFAQYTSSKHALAVTSCTAALHLAYFYAGIGKNDEVIVPSQTHVATAHAVELLGGKAVFVDSELETGNLDTTQIEDKITKKTKVLTVVHYLGMPVDMKKIKKIADKFDLFVVEDCALSLGAYFNGVHTGNIGDLGCFSFYPVKHITTGEGGMVISNNEDISSHINKDRAFGIDRQIDERKTPGIYDVQSLGFNYRMNEFQAAIGIEQLKKVDGFLKIRKENFERLYNGLKEIEKIILFKSSHDDFQSSYYCFEFVLKDNLGKKRYEIIKKLNNKGIGTSVYYPGPVPLMTYYKNKYGYNETLFPNATKISKQGIALPVGPHIGLEEIDYIISILKNVINTVK